jgi:hypothetical protein
MVELEEAPGVGGWEEDGVAEGEDVREGKEVSVGEAREPMREVRGGEV